MSITFSPVERSTTGMLTGRYIRNLYDIESNNVCVNKDYEDDSQTAK